MTVFESWGNPACRSERFDDLKFVSYISRITEVYRTQSVAWPHLMRGHSLILINAAKSGKTWTYLPAVCSLAMVGE